MIINNLTFLTPLISVCSPLIENKIILTFFNLINQNISTLLISTIVVFLPLIFFAGGTSKIVKRAGKWVLAGGSFAVGEQIIDGIFDAVKGWIPANQGGTTGGTLKMYEKYKTEIKEAFDKAENKADEISDILEKNSIIPDDFLNLINEFNEYLASLSTMEICLVINVTTCIFILTCIISILFAISGNYLINKFSLEQKLPKLSKIIQLRVKFQRYYVIINSVYIIFGTLSLIFVNTMTLIYS